MTVAMLSRYSLLLPAGVETQTATSRTQGSTVSIVIFQAWNLCSYLKVYRACPLEDEEIVEFSKLPPSLKIILETMTGTGIIPEVDAFMYVIISKAKKHVPYGELVDTTECKHYIRVVARTNVIITEFNCSLPFHIHFISPLPQACKFCIS
jgi:hypothetical protein